VPTRKCFTESQSGSAAFCATCDPSGTCQACVDGFNAPKCKDVERRLVEASFQVSSSNARLDVDPLTGPLSAAFELALKDAANISAKVVSITAMPSDWKLTALRRVSAAVTSMVKIVVVSVAKDDTDDELRQINRSLASVNGSTISKFLPKRMADAGCNQQANCTVPDLAVEDGASSAMCPWGGIWDPVKGCPQAYPPAPPGPPGPAPDGGFPVWVIVAIAIGAVILVSGGAAYFFWRKFREGRDAGIQLRSGV